MDNNQHPLNPAPVNQARFRHLSAEEIENPLTYIEELCERETALYYLNRDILDLVKTAYSYREEFFEGIHKSYAYNQIQVIKVVEILFVLYCGKLDLKSGNVRSYENNFSCLNRDEMNDIRVFLDDFFAFHSLSEWHEFIDDLLIHAYKEGSEGLFNNVKEPFKVMAYFEKLAEAIFLVYEIQRLKESYPKASKNLT
ncbi:hypothetical protein [Parapedobacter sp. 10938]|uniref:hypothetical protein n=1 Tax=Parapedobacter flavus TaxID=3110225 RepID=UPI002DBCE707|nr:hypothetical protein [Parapedobacter sp. 10938]MEC3881103.1 hypothetical protein [Parapedobacter sp. 10938]